MYAMGAWTQIVRAAISAFSPPTCYTNAATTTPAYMTPGTATSTVTCNLGSEGARTATIIAEVNATSTNSKYKIFVEESYDGIDYFPTVINQTASTTEASQTFDASVTGSVSYKFASTSTLNGVAVGGVGSAGINGTNNRNHFMVDVPVRLRYVRAYAVIPSPTMSLGCYDGVCNATTSYNGAIWMQILPKVDVN